MRLGSHTFLLFSVPLGDKRIFQGGCYTLFFFCVLSAAVLAHTLALMESEREHTVPAHATCFSLTCCFVAAKISSDEKTSDELGEFPELIRKRG